MSLTAFSLFPSDLAIVLTDWSSLYFIVSTVSSVEPNSWTRSHMSWSSIPLVVLEQVEPQGEAGLMGMTLDPDYSKNHTIYVCLTHRNSLNLELQVLRFTDQGVSLAEEYVVIDGVPAAQYHDGCELGFGPDKKLYVSTGDALDGNSAQDLESPSGKILRLNPDGSIPEDNPFPDSPVFSYGHRNIQGFDWDESGRLWASEHGPSGFDGPGGGDEINQIEAGVNYGWPEVSHEESLVGTKSPLLVFTPAIAPASVVIFGGKLYVALLKGEGILRMDLENFQHEMIPGLEVGRVRELVVGPDGNLYFTTSNRDGRGTASEGDDKIYRLSEK